MIHRPLLSPLLPYTTLFRSVEDPRAFLLGILEGDPLVGLFEGQGFARHRKAPRVDLLRRSEEHTSELQSQSNLVCRLLLEKKKIRATGTSTQLIYESNKHSN